jgi:hypothetical protein
VPQQKNIFLRLQSGSSGHTSSALKATSGPLSQHPKELGEKKKKVFRRFVICENKKKNISSVKFASSLSSAIFKNRERKKN